MAASSPVKKTQYNPSGPDSSKILLVDVSSKKVLHEIEIPYEEDVWELAISPDEKYLLYTLEDHGFDTKWLSVMEIESGSILMNKKMSMMKETFIGFHPTGNTFLTAFAYEPAGSKTSLREYHFLGAGDSTEYHLDLDGIIYAADFSPDGKILATGNSFPFAGKKTCDVTLIDWENKEVIGKLKGHTESIYGLKFGPDGKRLYSSSEDGTIRIWDPSNQEEISMLLGIGYKDYVISIPEGSYKSSKASFDAIGFNLHNNLYTFDQFDLVCNRPDKVVAKLGANPFLVKMYELAWKKRLKRMGFSESDLTSTSHLPELTVEAVGNSMLPLNTDEKEIVIRVIASDEKYSIARLNVYVNDVPMDPLSLKRHTAKPSLNMVQELSIPLSFGKNIIQISVHNDQGLESTRESFEINCNIEPEKRDLYLLCIGVSKFKDEKRNLTFAAKDAEDLSSFFQENKLFDEVHVKKILNEEATQNNITSSSAFLKNAKVDDVVLVYISSHGLLDEDLNYFLATYDVNFEDPQELGLPYDHIEDLISSCPSRNRLILIDACHSGEVDKDEEVVRSAVSHKSVAVNFRSGNSMIKPRAGLKNSFSYMKELFSDISKGTGATVISAAGGYEFALESQEWNNGVFTYAIIEGIREGSADSDHDGIVRVGELKDYVINRVSELTNGQQVPTTRTENQINDFKLFLY